MWFLVLTLISSAHPPTRRCAGSMRNTQQHIPIKITKPQNHAARHPQNQNLLLRKIFFKNPVLPKNVYFWQLWFLVSVLISSAHPPTRRCSGSMRNTQQHLQSEITKARWFCDFRISYDFVILCRRRLLRHTAKPADVWDHHPLKPSFGIEGLNIFAGLINVEYMQEKGDVCTGGRFH